MLGRYHDSVPFARVLRPPPGVGHSAARQAPRGPSDGDDVIDEKGRKEREGVVRGPPRRWSVEERTEAELALMAGKAKLDPLALTYGLRKETIDAWHTKAVAGVQAARRCLGPGA